MTTPIGLYALGGGDANIRISNHTSPIHLETQAVHLHIRKSTNSEVTIRVKGKHAPDARRIFSNIYIDYLHLHTHSVC